MVILLLIHVPLSMGLDFAILHPVLVLVKHVLILVVILLFFAPSVFSDFLLLE
jgi:hypothetical protein